MIKKTQTVKKTYRELLNLNMLVNSLQAENPSLLESKFGYGYKRFLEKGVQDIFDDYNLAVADIRVDNALINESTKAVLTNGSGRGFEYSKEGQKAVMAAELALNRKWFKKEFDVEPYFVKSEDLPKLNEDQMELIKGLLTE